MAHILEIPTYTDERGSLSVIEKIIPFKIKRIYYMYEVTQKRGGHRHKTTKQALICLGGSCSVYVNNGKSKKTFKLDRNNKCLVLEPEDWHTMDKFSENAILLVLASEYYDVEDYIDEEY